MVMTKAMVRVFTHHFSIRLKEDCPELRALIGKVAKWFDEYEWQEQGGQWVKQYSRTYASPEASNEYIDWKDVNLEHRFHINALPHLKALAKNQGIEDRLDIEVEPIYESRSVDIRIKDFFKPFDYQEPILEQACNEAIRSKLLGLNTGGGKSALAVFTAAHWGKMTVALMKPGYIDKWVNDINKQCDIPLEKIHTVFGSEQLIRLIMDLDDEVIDPVFVLISNATMRNWISEHEKMQPGENVPGFPIAPWQFMQHCGFGFRIIDEVHQDFHANFKFDLFTHVEQSLSLSATLVSRNEYLTKMYQMAYPMDNRLKVPESPKYIRSIAWKYEFFDPRRLRTTPRGRTTYSHTAFEKSIMNFSNLTKEYLHMVYLVMRKTFLFERKQGEKCLIYFSTIKMCEKAKSLLETLMPNLTFSKYNQGDDLNEAMKADVMIATLQKAGTAIDIPNLTTVILTIAIDSVQSNMQSMGRLRDIKRLYNSDRTPDFVYFVCSNIQKHLRYHKSKQEVLKDKAITMTTMHHSHQLGYK